MSGSEAQSRALTPDEVVAAQLTALQSEPREGVGAGAGIQACWDLASRGNREATGPVDRFADMLRSPAYLGLLEHRTVHLGPLVLDGDQAQQEVLVMTADDRTEGYTWVLARERASGRWLTDGVLRHEGRQR